MLPTTRATRYVAPLREGGSLPGLVEASDDGMWVLKLRGAGQGLKVLVAEVLVGEIGRTLGLRVPELKVVELPAPLARYEADEEVQDLLTASVGDNLGLDFLPGAFNYDGQHPPPPDEAARLLWLDAYTANIDRTPANPNLLRWHRQVWLIDHGAALYFHHGWPSRGSDPARFAAQRFDDSTHLMRPVVDRAPGTHPASVERLPDAELARIVDLVPDAWLEPAADLPDAAAVRAAYLDNLRARRDDPRAWLPGGLA